MSQEISIQQKIHILLTGELTYMNRYKVKSWFKEAYSYIEDKQRYLLGAQLKKTENRWQEQLENKSELVSNIFGDYYVTKA